MLKKTLLAVSFVAALALPALAGDVAPQIKNAADHATYAAGAANITAVKAHIHHAVNCLVGPKGAGYAADQMNPCANLGNGAIADAGEGETKTKLEAALKLLNDGLAASELAVAQKDAADAAAALKAIH